MDKPLIIEEVNEEMEKVMENNFKEEEINVTV